MRNRQFAGGKEKRGRGVWSIVGTLALLAVAAGVIATYPDIKRYIKISTM